MNSINESIYLSSPHMGGEELDFIHDAFDKNWIAPLGANINGLEEDLEDFTGREHAAAVHLYSMPVKMDQILENGLNDIFSNNNKPTQ